MIDQHPILSQVLPLVRRVAKDAASRPEQLHVDTKSSSVDVVTQMDKAAEAALVDGLRELFPNDAIVGEEGAAVRGTSGREWVLDPIDGTVNYVYNWPAWAVSVALVDAQSHAGIVGIVLVPSLGLEFVAAAGAGAWERSTGDWQRLSVSNIDNLEQTLVATGFGYTPERRIEQAKVLGSLLAQVRDIRRSGSCAVDLCLLASGRTDAYYEQGLNHWDYAAAALIANEAGALVTGLDSPVPNARMLIAANPVLHEKLRDLLASS